MEDGGWRTEAVAVAGGRVIQGMKNGWWLPSQPRK